MALSIVFLLNERLYSKEEICIRDVCRAAFDMSKINFPVKWYDFGGVRELEIKSILR